MKKNILMFVIKFALASVFLCLQSCTLKVKTGAESQTKHGGSRSVGDLVNFDVSQLSKTAEMLDENLYWSIIEKSLERTTNEEAQMRFLVGEIKQLTPKQMIGFRLRTDRLLSETYNSAMWCAGYIMNGGCSDDGFEYFRNWVISRGKAVYTKAKQNPDNLIDLVTDKTDVYELEDFWYVALDAFKETTGKDLNDYIDYDNFKTREGNYPQLQFTWSEENPESRKKICPRLFKHFEE